MQDEVNIKELGSQPQISHRHPIGHENFKGWAGVKVIMEKWARTGNVEVSRME